LEYRRILGDAFLQNRRERIRKTGLTVFYRAPHRAGILLSRARTGTALDGKKEAMNEFFVA
jgi:hypothetical protein